MSNKLITSIVFMLLSMQCIIYSEKAEAQKSATRSNASIQKEEMKTPNVFYVDSTAIGLLDGKLITTKTLVKLANEDKTIRAIRFLHPKDAILKYGEVARGGIYICATIKGK
jgi:hypothetical protein